MVIKKLELKNYRNYEELSIVFDEKRNLLYGDNAQGKTNILESVYVCATTKSYRCNKDKELINFNAEEGHIRVSFVKKEIPYTIDMHLKKNKSKGIAVNGVPVKKASEIFGLLNVVCFSPEDLDIIKEGPSQRRKFIDLELCQLDSVYVRSLINYNKILIQKNKLLKEAFNIKGADEILDVYDEQLKKYGEEVSALRKNFIDEMNPVIKRIHYALSGEKEELKLVYEKCEFKYPGKNSIENISNNLSNNLNNNLSNILRVNINNNIRSQELKLKTSLTGPHRDDIAFYLNDIDLRKYGSQGQQRTAALSLKLAELEIVEKKTGECPVLLLDDVLSELDVNRQNKLLQQINKVQTIITCTGVEEFISKNFKIANTMLVKEGKVKKMEE